MTYVIGSPCEGVCEASCAKVCPVECIYSPIPMSEIEEIRTNQKLENTEKSSDLKGIQLYINPDECIDCDACVAECPVEAIASDLDQSPHFDVEEYREINEKFFEDGNTAYNSSGQV